MGLLYHTKKNISDSCRTDIYDNGSGMLIGFVRKGGDGNFLAFPLTGNRRSSVLSMESTAIGYIVGGVYYRGRKKHFDEKNVNQLKFNLL